MKAVFDEMNNYYDKKNDNFNKSKCFCHSMNIEDYKILYKDFFADKKNVYLEQTLSEETDFDAEKIYVDWLKKE